MEDAPVKTACVLNGLDLVHRWVEALEGPNRGYAFELMNLVMVGELTTEKAFSLLDNA
jgi:hypothetical protein